jgi:hypothetical protein
MKNFIICNATGDEEINSEQMVRVWSTHEVNQNPLQNLEVRHLRFVRVNIKHDVGDSQNTTNYLFATAGVQDSNNYMFRAFLLAIIRLFQEFIQ